MKPPSNVSNRNRGDTRLCRFPHIQFTLLEKDGAVLTEHEQEDIFIDSQLVGMILFNFFTRGQISDILSDDLPGASSSELEIEDLTAAEEAGASSASDIPPPHFSHPPLPDRQGNGKRHVPHTQSLVGEMELVFPTEIYRAGEACETSFSPAPSKNLCGRDGGEDTDSGPTDNIVLYGAVIAPEQFTKIFASAFRDMLWTSLQNFTHAAAGEDSLSPPPHCEDCENEGGTL